MSHGVREKIKMLNRTAVKLHTPRMRVRVQGLLWPSDSKSGNLGKIFRPRVAGQCREFIDKAQ